MIRGIDRRPKEWDRAMPCLRNGCIQRGRILLSVCFCLLPAMVLADKVALVIGNASYQHVSNLRNPANDAADIAYVLRGIGFDVTTGLDLDYRGMRLAMRDFGEKAMRSLIRNIQTELNRVGCGAGTADGVAGPRTRAAFSRYVSARGNLGLTADKLGTGEALTALKKEKGRVCKKVVVPSTATFNVDYIVLVRRR